MKNTMKKMTAVLLVAFATPAIASVSCDDMALVASKMMQYRQAGVPYQQVVSAIPKEDARIYLLFKTLADDAYKYQIYERGEVKVAVTHEYSEVIRGVCNSAK